MIHIDGSFGEGGGQILRTSLSLAAITGQDVTIENIRANRDKPGLRPQHLTSALSVAEICGAELRGAEVGSSSIIFKPHHVKPGRYEFDISRIRASAGSVNLVLQSIIWPLALAGKKSQIVIKGGTHVPHAPTFNFIHDTFLPTIARMGLICNYEMIRAGYYPIGGGEVRLETTPVEELKPIVITEKPGPMRVELTSAVSNLPTNIAERQMSTGLERVRAMGYKPETRLRDYPSPGKGTVFFISAESGDARGGFQSLGAIGKRAEKVAEEACDAFEDYIRSKTAVDEHLADQIVIPMALAKGESTITTSRITQHLLTNIAIVQKFLPVGFHVSRGLGEAGTVRKITS